MEKVEEPKVDKALEQAQALIQAKENEKAQNFLNDYKALCSERGYQMSPIITLTANGIVPDLQVIKTK